MSRLPRLLHFDSAARAHTCATEAVAAALNLDALKPLQCPTCSAIVTASTARKMGLRCRRAKTLSSSEMRRELISLNTCGGMEAQGSSSYTAHDPGL